MRYLTAGNFFFALLMFFLPWLDVRCDAGKEIGKVSWVTQSGLQAATGKFSTSSNAKDGKGGGDNPQKQIDKHSEGDVSAPLLWVYVLALAAGGVICLIGAVKPWRIIAVSCVGLAVLILAIQTAVGFPVEDQVAKINQEGKAAKEALGAPNKAGGANMPKFDIGGEFYVVKMFGYYLAWLFTLTTLVFIALGAPKKPGKYGQKYNRSRRERDDDEEDDDEPDRDERRRPRRGNRDDDDDET